jgi:hypothetical protein
MNPKIGRPLWRLFFTILAQKPDATFSCDECFHMLEYLSAIKARKLVSPERLYDLLKKHTVACPGCNEHYFRVLQHMEYLYQ